MQKIMIYNKIMTKILGFIMLMTGLVIPLTSMAATQNLDEMIARKSRQSVNTWPTSQLENPGNNYIWQPETLMYYDVYTGHEVWRMTNTKDLDNFYHNDISWSQWSADGKWLAFASDRDTQAFKRTTSKIWMVVKTNGSNLMPLIGSSFRGYSSYHPYFHWSPQIPDVFYDTGEAGNGLGLNGYDVYKNILSDKGATRQFLLTTYTYGGNSKTKKLAKGISGDGKKIILKDHYIAEGAGPYYLYPCTVYPDANAICDNPRGYSIDRNQGAVYGDMPTTYTSDHGDSITLAGNEAAGYYFTFMVNGASVAWQCKLTGSALDGGPLYTPPGTAGEVKILTSKVPVFPPWPNHYYMSHASFDWWGTKAVFSNVQDGGIAHINVLNHSFDSRIYLNDWGAQHHDWHGFTDYTVSSYTPHKKLDGLGQRITSQRYNDATNTDIKTVCFTHTRYNGGTLYSTLPRPFISPDGTKVAWTSEFLNASPNKNDIFWTVIRYPKPPTNLRAYKNGEYVRLTWERPTYTIRGWPDELRDDPPKSKEIKGYHVWYSFNGDTDWQELTGMARVNDYYDITQSNGSTVYYAVTSEEHSGLESRILSEVRKVTMDRTGYLTDSQYVQFGKTRFWTKVPPAPSPSTVVIPAGGTYRLNWIEPMNTRVRYYNIYYSSVGFPPVDQRYRIASIPTGTRSYIDWLADRSRPGYYRLTSVDRQGNEVILSAPQNIKLQRQYLDFKK